MVLIIVEPNNGQINKGSFELASFGSKTAALLGTSAEALVIGQCNNAGDLGIYGVSKVHHIVHENLADFDSQVYSKLIADAAQKLGAKTIVIRHTANGKSIAGRVAVRLNASLVSGVNSLPTNDGEFLINKSVYSGKAIATYKLTNEYKVLTLMGNTIQPASIGSTITAEPIDIEVMSPKIKVINKSTQTGITPLPEAEKVVSAGRGMKEPGNWGIIEELATTLGATTACSRPVADIGWRPHHEHVGQTGVAIRPNLYIAIGISGAIQHLAGVNNSKTIVVINKDPEAPFFKAADYGVVGDLFEVVPKLNEALKKFKANH